MGSNPHDALFKAVFAQPEHARGALRAVLPPALADALDWTTLARRPGSFVDPQLRERHTDLLFSAALRDGGEALVYLLFEHQSTVDRQMAFRLLRYLVRIWEGWQTEHPGVDALPAIIPVVLYHGAAPWSAPRSFEALLDLPDELGDAARAYVPRFAYLVDDLSEIPDPQLRERAMTALATLAAACFKHARTRADLVELLGEWADLLREVVRAPHGLEALAQLVRYTLLVSDHVEPQALETLLEREVGLDAKETVVTVGQQLIEQGIQRGIARGIEQGKLEGERALLLRQLEQRFGDAVNAEIAQRIATASAAQLEIWAVRVLSAATLSELLAD